MVVMQVQVEEGYHDIPKIGPPLSLPSLGRPSLKSPVLTGFASANGRARTNEESWRSFIVKLFVCCVIKQRKKLCWLS